MTATTPSRPLASAVLAALVLVSLAPATATEGTGDVWCWSEGWYPGRADGSCHAEDRDLSTALPIRALPPLELLTPALGTIAVGVATPDPDTCRTGYERLHRDDGSAVCATDVRPAR